MSDSEPKSNVIPFPLERVRPPGRPKVNLQLFALQIENGDRIGAAASLAELFALDSTTAQTCVRHFANELGKRTDLMSQAMQLRQMLTQDQIDPTLILLAECFGLAGEKALAVAIHLRKGMVG